MQKNQSGRLLRVELSDEAFQEALKPEAFGPFVWFCPDGQPKLLKDPVLYGLFFIYSLDSLEHFYKIETSKENRHVQSSFDAYAFNDDDYDYDYAHFFLRSSLLLFPFSYKSIRQIQSIQNYSQFNSSIAFSQAFMEKCISLQNFWSVPRKVDDAVDVMVHPDNRRRFENLLNQKTMNYFVSVDDVQKLIERLEVMKPKEASRFWKHDHRSNSGPYFNFHQFHNISEINGYLYSVQQRYPDITKLHVIGYTHENRPILTIQIGYPLNYNKNKAIWVDAGMHAREWASQTSAVYLIFKLVTEFSHRLSMRKYIYNLTWYITPVANPDGYEYTRSSTAPDVDLNRNFDFYWGGAGSSNFPCEDTYGGKESFSEPESRAIRDFVWQRRKEIRAFITIHTYSQLWIHPYSHKRKSYPSDLADLRETAIKATEALKHPSAGGSDDWAKYAAKIKYVYLLELRPDEDRRYGFIVDPDQVLPIARETWEGIKVVADKVIEDQARE
ncbi:Carboxypeptidase A2 [Trichinella spiralis]|uniref:Carboxypeptidase A2 n=1 Tax=Trichinella spiralis TaxID=6334 RepID=A0A0V1B662_TRISP|nr:Carboxypeptidase A2 [Trichinella spiralis]